MEKKISVVIIAQDEEERIADAIDSCLPFADEVLVVDGGSRDGTREVAERAGARVVVNPWPGYSKQRNHGASLAEHDWVLCLDSDEEVDTGLASLLLEWKKTCHDQKHAFAVDRIGDFWGRWLYSTTERNGVRLYNKKEYNVIDRPIHERLIVPAENIHPLKGVIWHRGFRSVHDHIERFNLYTTLEAKAAAESGRKFSIMRLLLRPAVHFSYKYFYQQLFRYGLPGLAVAYLWFIYDALIELKLYEIEWRRKSSLQAQGRIGESLSTHKRRWSGSSADGARPGHRVVEHEDSLSPHG